MTELIQALQKRYATKIFDTAKGISDADLEIILQAANLAPTSFGLQPFRIIRVEDPGLRTKLQEVSYNQRQVTEASVFLVIAIRTDIDEAYVTSYIERIAHARNTSTESLQEFKAAMLGALSMKNQDDINAWSAKQSYIALGTMIAAASELGIDSAPMEGFDSTSVDQILELSKDNLKSTAYLALGHRSSEDKTALYTKVRLPISELIINK